MSLSQLSFFVTHDKSWVCEDLLHHLMHKFNKEVDLSNCKKKKNNVELTKQLQLVTGLNINYF